MTSLVAIGRRVTGVKLSVRELLVRAQAFLVLAALLLPLTSWGRLDVATAFGGAAVFPADLLVLAALASWLVVRAVSAEAERPRLLVSPVVRWPLLVFAALLVPGIVRGHERYGESLVAQPLRLVIYAAIAAAMTELTARQAFRWLTAGLYAGAAWQAALAAYHIATNTSQTPIDQLSTGGTRVLSLTTGMFLGTALVAALVNLELASGRRARLLHAFFGAVATGGIILAFGRTTFLALIVVLPFLAWQLPKTRRVALHAWRWWVPALVAIVAAVAVLSPGTATKLVDRVTANPLTDHSVRWRVAGIHAVLAGMKSGQWDTRTGLLAADATGNQLVNASFEHGTGGWFVQGGSLYTLPSVIPGYGPRSLALETFGQSADEGLYSSPVVAKEGQTWRFSIWLQGRSGGETMNVSIWEYNDREEGIRRAELPVVLTPYPTQYSVKMTVDDPTATHIRALVRTQQPEATTVFADLATLRRVDNPEAQGTHGLTTEYADGSALSPTIRSNGFSVDASPEAFDPSGANRLANGSFEDPGSLGGVQGGRLRSVGSFSPVLGSRSLLLQTQGKSQDEGWYSSPVPVQPGETWSFAVWLQGQEGDQMLVSLWLYGSRRLKSPVGNLNFVVTLSGRPTRYVVTGVIPPGGAQFARGVVRTRAFPQRTQVLLDGATVYRHRVDPASVFPATTEKTSFQVDEPLLGLGFGRQTQYVWEGTYYRVKGDPDNSYVYLLAGGGILALGAFLLLLGSFVRDAFRRLRRATGVERALVLWALSAWFIVAVNCAMAPFLPRPKIVLSLWVLMLLPALARRGQEDPPS